MLTLGGLYWQIFARITCYINSVKLNLIMENIRTQIWQIQNKKT